MKRPIWKCIVLMALLPLNLYVGSYLVLSRRGMAEARAYGAKGFWFFPPANTDSWRFWNFGFYRFYYPLIALDTKFGAGMGFGAEPLWGLSREPDNDLQKPP